MENSSQSHSRQTGTWKQHRLLVVSTSLIVLFTVLLTTLPIFIKNTISSTLSDLGAQNVSIDDVDFNLFTSELVIKKTKYEISGFEPFKCKRAAVNIDLLPIFSRHFFIYSLGLNDCNLYVQRSDQGAILLNGLSLPLNRQTDPESKDTETSQSPQWFFGLHQLNISELTIKYKEKSFQSDFYIKQFSIGDMIQWQPDLSSSLTFSFAVNNTPFSLNGSMQPFHKDRNFIGKLSLNKFDIKPFTPLINSEDLSLQDGFITSELDISSSLKDSNYDVDIDGFITSDSFMADVLGNELSYEKLLWNGRLQFAIDTFDNSVKIFTDNDIVINKPLLASLSNHLNISGDTVAAKVQFSHNPKNQQKKVIHISGTTDINTLSVIDSDKKILIAQLGSIEANDFDISDNLYFIPSLVIKNTRMVGSAQLPSDKTNDKPEYLARFANLILNDLQIVNQNSISIAEIKLADLNSQLIIDEKGKLKYINELQETFSNMPSNDKAEKPSKESETQKDNKTEQELTYKLGVIETQGKNLFVFKDFSRSPRFQINFRDINFKLVSIDNSNPNNKTKINFSTQIDEAGKANFAGESQLFSKQLNTDIKGKINNLELNTLTSYSLPFTGRKIRQGSLDADIDFVIKNKTLDNKLDFTIRKISLIKDDDKIAAKYDSAMPLPMESTVDFLKDKKGNINISVPVKGNIDDPDFEYMTIVYTAMRQTFQYTALSYLKHTLQPWGTLISVGELIAGQMSKIVFEPVVFAAGQTQLTPEQTQYLDKMAALLLEKPSLSIAVCGVATNQDKMFFQTKAAAPEKPDTNDQNPLLLLAQQRASTVRNYFTAEKQIAKERLRSCSPIYKDSENATPMVELLF